MKCVIQNCSNRYFKGTNISFFSIPTVIRNRCDVTRSRSERRRAAWLSVINRSDFLESSISKKTGVCSMHFISGAPSALHLENNPDWVPSLNLGYTLDLPLSVTDVSPEELNSYFEVLESDPYHCHLTDNVLSSENMIFQNDYLETCEKIRKYRDIMTDLEVDKLELRQENERLQIQVATLSLELETMKRDYENNMESLRLQSHMQTVLDTTVSNDALKQQLMFSKQISFCDLDTFAMDEEKVKFYTGFPSTEVFKICLKRLTDHMGMTEHGQQTKPWQCFLLTLMRLKHSLSLQDLAYRFGIDKSTACRIFNKWNTAMSECSTVPDGCQKSLKSRKRKASC